MPAAAAAACLVAAAAPGCGHGSAAASASGAGADRPSAEVGGLARVLRAERASGRWDPGEFAITIVRPIPAELGADQPPADRRPHHALSPREVAMSVAMYGEAGRWREQWMLLAGEARRDWTRRLREEAWSLGLPAAAGVIDEGHAGWIWSRGLAAGEGVADLAVRWDERITADRARVEVRRGDRVVQWLHLRRELGRWWLEVPLGGPSEAGG